MAAPSGLKGGFQGMPLKGHGARECAFIMFSGAPGMRKKIKVNGN